MANPNLKQITSVFGKTSILNLTSTNQTTLLSNASSSNAVLKINTVIIANIDSSNAIDITLKIHLGASGSGTANEIASNITVPAKASVVLISRDSPIYLEEDRSLTLTASVANKLKATISYEEIL